MLLLILGGVVGAIIARVAIDLVLDWRDMRYLESEEYAKWLEEASDDWLRLCGVYHDSPPSPSA